jgi:eukaryotic-like serine/threonine-protein kinase
VIVVSEFMLDDGSAVAVGTVIAEAGQGRIYQVLGRTDGAVKLFDADTPQLSARLDKVAAMIASPLVGAVADDGFVTVAWPRRLVLDDGRPVGYLMPRIDAPPVAGIHGRPWSHRVAMAVNLCAVVDLVHGAGIVLGDLQDHRILVSGDDRITLTDCDAMQFVDATGHRFLSPAGRGEFTAPELANVDLAVTVREKSSDLFGLAVNIYLLLMGGKHPFKDGVWTGEGAQPDPLTLAASGNWSGGPASRFAADPSAPPVTFLPVRVQELFDRAFADGARNPALRPSAVEWREALRRIEIKTCARDPAHEMPVEAARCPWCPPADDHSVAALSPVAPARSAWSGLSRRWNTKWLIAAAASLVVIAVVAVAVIIKYHGGSGGLSGPSTTSGPTDAAAANTGPFTGTYHVSYGPRTDLDGRPRNASAAGTETWLVRSTCDASGCAAIADRQRGGGQIVFDQVGGRWLAVESAIERCGDLPSAPTWNVYLLQPQTDGALSGTVSVGTASGCADMWTLAFTRIEGTDFGGLPDPAGLPARVVSPAEGLHGRYHFTETGQGVQTGQTDYQVLTACERTGARCMSMFHNPEQVMADVFDGGQWTEDTVGPNPCSDGVTQTVRWTTVIPLPPTPGDPITQLSGHGHLAILKSNGSSCEDADYDVQMARTGD